MAQLPPRAPSAGEQDWPVAGEFLGFAAARRGVHRRSASDPAAFLEAVPMDHILSGGGGFGDPKRVKRILANRQSAQRSRVRKLQYISELERSVTGLQMEVSALSPRVAFLDHQRSLLTVGNSHLRQRIAALAQDKIFKDAHQEALKEEIERLRQLFHHQKIKATGGTDMATAASMQAKQELLMCEGAAMR
ncbi:unnamed protein product [Triticum turgidum subsp. durum]|uniref:BZIP domain-containing protein n=1 Tax=Triticum turgidum subsp. durum TaxID=4567 RepID=A0A9R0WM99_TRITD|nr:unnamed protein product [Triticum turgidum subsp. durum]